ncbi:MAG: hypothetical protein AB8B78_05450 [Polaribacter sp.]
MKKVFLLLMTISLFNCSSNDEVLEVIPEASVVGRWNLDGFQKNVMYEFTDNKRFTLYSSNGVFETTDELIANGRTGNDWWFDGNKITVDLNFGNLSTLTPTFKCDNNVIVWTNDLNEVHSTYYREGYDLSNCKE